MKPIHMFSSIRDRLWLSYAALIVAALAIISVVLTVFLVRNPYIYRQTALRLKAAENLLVRDPRTAGRTELVAEALSVRVLVFAPSGSLLSDTAPQEPALRDPALQRRPKNLDTIRDVTGNPWFYSLRHLPDGNWMLVAAPRPAVLPALDVIRDELWRPLVQGGLVALVLALLLAYVLARWIADPMQRLIQATRAVAAPGSGAQARSERKLPAGGNPGAAGLSIDRGPKEVRELALAFKAMLERVDASQRSQKAFVANVSHELKTPLTSIQGFSQALIDGAADSPEARRQAAEIIHAEAGRMHRMATDLLELARLDAGTAELRTAPVNLKSLLADIERKFMPLAASAGIRLSFHMDEEGALVTGDSDRLGQVFSNLLENALKFTPRGGEVKVMLRRAEGEVQVAVGDSGPGIAAEAIPHIFDRFYQMDQARGGGAGHGVGLGLAIARDLAEAHGGRITVRSTFGQGAEFLVRLPPLDGSRVGRGAASRFAT